jgi:hypothetical protein
MNFSFLGHSRSRHRNKPNSNAQTLPDNLNNEDDSDSEVYHEDQSSRDISPPRTPSPTPETRRKLKKTIKPPGRNNERFQDESLTLDPQPQSEDDFQYPTFDEYENYDYSEREEDDSTPFPWVRNIPKDRTTPKLPRVPFNIFNDENDNEGGNENNYDQEEVEEEQLNERTTTKAPFKVRRPGGFSKRKESTSLTTNPTGIKENPIEESVRRKDQNAPRSTTSTTVTPSKASSRRRKQPKRISSRVEPLNVDDKKDESNKEDFNESDEEDGPEALCKDPTGQDGFCQEYFRCSVLYAGSSGKINLEDYRCKLPNKQVGICCPTVNEKDTQGPSGN